jgi:hypothetical protein
MVEGNHIYNLLTIGLSRYAHFPLLVEVNMLLINRLFWYLILTNYIIQCLERAMKLAFEEFHLWFQFGLALANARKVHSKNMIGFCSFTFYMFNIN